MGNERIRIKISGIVQGVGFRPFVYSLAKSLSLNGWVCNVDSDVLIEVEGNDLRLQSFIRDVKAKAPPLSAIKSIETESIEYFGYLDFEIRESSSTGIRNIYISPDVATCRDCLAELFDKWDRRHLYPFTNCTNCGPRFTITRDVPYDRINTTMDSFAMCDDCAKEYNSPLDRRYHAQPISCYKCGPRLVLADANGNDTGKDNLTLECSGMIREGKIIAVKGLGGYHLVCDATNKNAVTRLRRRKVRDDKPFALMARDLESALKYCHINEKEQELLLSEKKPIVLLKKKRGLRIASRDCTGK